MTESFDDGSIVLNTYEYYKNLSEKHNAAFDVDESVKPEMDYFDEIAGEVVTALDGREEQFVLNADRFNSCRQACLAVKNGREYAYNAEYRNIAPDQFRYHLFLNIPINREDATMTCAMVRFRADSGTAEFFDVTEEDWISDDDMQYLYELFMSENPRHEVFLDMEDYFGKPVFLLDPKTCMEIVKKNEPLLDLADRLDGIGKLKLLVPYSDDGDPADCSKVSLILASSDHLRKGCGIVFHDGKFYAMRMSLGMYETDSIVFRCMEGHTGRMHDLFETAFITDDMDKLYEYLMKLWDHSDRNVYWYSMPVSGNAMACFPAGNHGIDIVTMDGAEPTGSELNRVEILKEVFTGE